MKLAIMQPYFFPYIGYFQLINAVDKYILLDELFFIKEAWINRNCILNKSSKKTDYISVPLEKKSSNKKICEVKIFNKFNWKRKFLNAIYLNYKGSLYFEETYNFVERLIDFSTNYISELNKNSITKICEYLQINTRISSYETYFNEVEDLIVQDTFRESSDRKKYPVKVLRILEFCNRENADVFYNAVGGQALYDKRLFCEHNIELGFVKTDNIIYKQFDETFYPNLSIIDVMMHNTKDDIREILNQYKII